MTTKDIIACPFCEKMGVEIIHQFSTRITTKSGGRKGHKYSVHSGDAIVSGCHICKKTMEEIQKKYKEEFGYTLK